MPLRHRILKQTLTNTVSTAPQMLSATPRITRHLVPSVRRTLMRSQWRDMLKHSGRAMHRKFTSQPQQQSFWQRFLGPKPMPERGTWQWYREITLICTVFGITGTSSMLIVRPAVSNVLGIRGSMKEGPWAYRICSLVLLSPIYATLLVGVGTLFGRHHYFRHFAIKIISRFGIPPESLDATYHQTKHTFRKW